MHDSMTVSELNRYVRTLLENDILTQMVNVSGEISNCKRHSSGHIYFALKDEYGSVNCSFFKNYNAKLKFEPEDGMFVTVSATATVYERDGKFQLLVYKMKESGTGPLYEKFEALKRKLEEEGLFSPENKKPIPPYPKRIAVLTSPTGAAVRDIINITGRRAPNIELIVIPVPVQGSGAAGQIAKALRYTESFVNPDLILIARGGGSIEDLWCFNDEALARTIAACKIPIISGVGHEIDYTICDFAADLRAPTPSAAAELATPNNTELLQSMENQLSNIGRTCQRALESSAQRLDSAMSVILSNAPQQHIQRLSDHLHTLFSSITAAMKSQISAARASLDAKMANLEALNPFQVLARGYAIVSSSKQMGIHDINVLSPGDHIEVRLENGSLLCTVDSIQNYQQGETNEKDR